MTKIVVAVTLLLCLPVTIFAREQSDELKKLEFLLGEWESLSVNQETGEEFAGNSSVQWIIGGKWLQWKFVAKREEDPLEVLTLMNYDEARGQYLFISFNPVDDEPIPHHGNWVDASTLRIETDFQGVDVRVDFKIEGDGKFLQEHSRMAPSGERVITSRTTYSRRG